MLAYHNDPQLKQQILEQLQGSGWNVFIEDYKNGLGIPKTLIYLHDAISRGLPNYLAKNWPIRFISSIQVGADLSYVWADFAVWLLVDPVDGVIQYTNPGTEVHEIIIKIANLYQHGYTAQQMRNAGFAAARAASTAYISSATDAGYIATSVAATGYAYAGAHAARKYSAYVGAHAARKYSAYVGAHAACDNENNDIYKNSRNIAYIKMANKLIELLKNSDITRTENVSLP